MTQKSSRCFSNNDFIERTSSPDAFGHYIISMTHDASHVLEVMLIEKMVGLVGKDQENEYFCNILITPLFETIDDLARIKYFRIAFFK